MEFRFLKSSAHETFKSNLEFRYQIIVSLITFRKAFAKFMILIALFKKFLERGKSFRNGKLTISELKVTFIMNFGRNNIIRN